MAKLVIFDLDGTLLYTLQDLADASNHALESFGHPTHPVDAYKAMVGRGTWNLTVASMPPEYRGDEDAVARVHALFQRYYNAHGTDNTRPYPGVLEMLEAVRGAGRKTAVLSNKPHVFTVPMVAGYFPGLVDLAVGQKQGVPIKPDPTAVGQILTHFGLLPEDCVYVGDSNVDMETGRNAGLFTVGVTWGYRTEQELRETGASAIVHKVEELQNFLIDK